MATSGAAARGIYYLVIERTLQVKNYCEKAYPKA